MIAEWHTYSIEDFIPFTVDTYFRLIERHNEAWWPWHFAAILLGIGVVLLIRAGKGRWAGIPLAAAWIWVGAAFHIDRYSSLVWAADYFGWASIAQGVLLLLIGLLGGLHRPARAWPVWLGYALVIFGLALYPLLALAAGRGWAGTEWFGMFPDPTVVFTFGVLLMAVRGLWFWLAMIVPLLWCVISGATVWALEVPLALTLPLIGAAALAGAVRKSIGDGQDG